MTTLARVSISVAWLLLGCAGQAPPASSPPTVAVLPFENLVASDEGGRAITRLCETALGTRDDARMAEPALVEETLAHLRIRVPTLMTAVQRDSLRAIAGCDYVITGSVLAYGHMDHVYVGRVGVVSFTAQLVSLTDGRTVWARTYSRQGSDSQTFFGLGAQHEPGIIAEKLCRQMIGDIPWKELRR